MVGLRVTGSEIGRVASGARCGEYLMANAAQKVTLSPSRDIPFDKLVLNQSNVRRIKSAVSIDELAEGGHRAAWPSAEPERATRPGCRARRDRYVRNSGWWSALRSVVAAGEAEAVAENRHYPLHRAGCHLGNTRRG